jgi:hypothetical protein
VREIFGPVDGVLDLEPVFAEKSEKGIPGNDLFYDHCHPRLEAQALIAKAALMELASAPAGREPWLKNPPDGLDSLFDNAAAEYIKGLPPHFYAEGYYRLAVEIGLNMGLKELGRKYFEMGMQAEPDNDKLNRIKDRFN